MTATSPTAAWQNRQGVARRLLDAVEALPVRIETVGSSQLVLSGATAFDRVTTIVELGGGGHVGRGEDIAYDPAAQAEVPAAVARLGKADDGASVVGEWTIASLAAHLDEHPLQLGGTPGWDDKPGYHRWAIESAALDLALRQADTDLATLVGEQWRPVRVSLSLGLGDPASTGTLQRWLRRDPTVTFKLDTSSRWTHELVRELADLGAVATVDFKGLYRGDWADNDPDPALYDAVGRGLPAALLEDARLTDEVLDALQEDALGRLSWDAPITAPEDVPGLPGSTASFSDLRPAAINVKPSRFGSLGRLLRTIDLCDVAGIPCYAGGQFELGYGRTHVQAIASLCFPDAPNDCAPVRFHGASPEDDDLPLGAVVVPAAGRGFGWDSPTPARALDA